MVTLVWWLAGNALVVAVLMPAVWLLCCLLRRRPAVQHVLWMLLFFKLVAPPVIDWPWRADSLASLLPPEPVSETNSEINTEAPVALPIDNVLDVVAAVAPSEHNDLSLAPVQPAAEEIEAPPLRLEKLFALVWIAGATLLAIYTVIALRRQRKVLGNSVQAPQYLVAAIARVAAKLGLRPPTAAVSDQITVPLVCCLGRPRLLWPATMNDPEAVQQSGGVIAHELAHLARRDHYLVYAELLVSMCCWWNPLAWIIRRQLRETRELACDAVAIAAVGEPRPDYAQRILCLSVLPCNSLSFAPAFGAGTRSRRFLKRRLIMVFDDRASGRLTLGGLVLAVFLAAVALPGFMWGDAAADAQAVSAGSESIAGEPASTSSATTESESESTVDGVKERKSSRMTSLKRLIKKEEMTGEKPAEIKLGSGGVIRISKNEQGDLVVTVELTETNVEKTATSIAPGTARNVTIGTTDGIAIDVPGEAETASVRSLGKRASTGTGAATSFLRTTRRENPGSSSYAGAAAAEFDQRLLRSDVELAEVSLQEKHAELEIAKKDKVDEPRLKLAELAVRRAQIELERAKLRLLRGSAGASRQ